MRKKDDEKQNSIKKAVVTIVLEQGMHGASISKIAKAAGVSPATVYVYYENKDVMLRSIYYEYAEAMFQHILEKLSRDLPVNTFIDLVVREYYLFMLGNEDIYHFIDQFSSCPSLSQGCMALIGPDELNAYIVAYKEQGDLKDYDNSNIWSMLFYPVKGIVKKTCAVDRTQTERLDEMIMIIKRALLK